MHVWFNIAADSLRWAPSSPGVLAGHPGHRPATSAAGGEEEHGIPASLVKAVHTGTGKFAHVSLPATVDKQLAGAIPTDAVSIPRLDGTACCFFVGHTSEVPMHVASPARRPPPTHIVCGMGGRALDWRNKFKVRMRSLLCVCERVCVCMYVLWLNILGICVPCRCESGKLRSEDDDLVFMNLCVCVCLGGWRPAPRRRSLIDIGLPWQRMEECLQGYSLCLIREQFLRFRCVYFGDVKDVGLVVDIIVLQFDSTASGHKRVSLSCCHEQACFGDQTRCTFE